jgi:hypothetical protein
MAGISIKNGEGKWLKFTITNASAVVDVSTYTFRLGVKKNINDTTYNISKTNAAFNFTQATLGIVKVNIATTETTAALLPPGDYVAELEMTATAVTDVSKSVTFDFIVEKAVLA